MATGGVTNYSCCSPCLDDGRNTVARHYCVDCEMYFCTKCVKCHNKIPASKAHQVNDVDSPDSTVAEDDITNLQSDLQSESVPGLKCTLHRGKRTDTYCKYHHEVCCGACALVKHRACTTVAIAIAAKEFKTNPELNTCKEALTECIAKYTDQKNNRAENRNNIDTRKLELIETVDKYEEKLIENIKELANISRTEIRDKCEEHKADLDKDIAALDVVITSATRHVDQLEQTDDELLFILAKTTKTLIMDGEKLLTAMTVNYGKRVIKLNLDEVLDNRVREMESICSLDIDLQATMYNATLLRNINIKQSNDLNDTSVRDMCFVDSGELLITDDDNNKLKRFNSDLQFKDEIQLPGDPIAVCKIDKHEVAVRIWGTRAVYIVFVGSSMQITSSFTFECNGNVMAYDADGDAIVACESNRVSMYSKTGRKLRTYDMESEGAQIFSLCRQIALKMDERDIYVADEKEGLIVLDKSGTLKMKVPLSGMSDTRLLCLLPGDVCLVGSSTSGVIVQIDKEGKEVGTLIDANDVHTNTYCAVYDREHSMLIVGGFPNVISVYKLSGTDCLIENTSFT